MINTAWDDVKTDGSSSLPASEYNDLVAAVKHTSVQAAYWATFDAATIYTFKVAATERMRISYASSVTTIQGGVTTGDDIVLKASNANAYPKIVLQGNTTADIYAVSGVNLYSSATNYGRFAYVASPSDFKVIAVAANTNISLVPTGTGLVKFGTYAAKTTEVHTGFTTMLDSGGTSRKVMICA